MSRTHRAVAVLGTAALCASLLAGCANTGGGGDIASVNGQKISRYEIVSEEPQDGLTFFSVRLTPKGRGAAKVVRYVVVGRDPLWVYREDDYKTKAGM